MLYKVVARFVVVLVVATCLTSSANTKIDSFQNTVNGLPEKLDEKSRSKLLDELHKRKMMLFEVQDILKTGNMIQTNEGAVYQISRAGEMASLILGTASLSTILANAHTVGLWDKASRGASAELNSKLQEISETLAKEQEAERLKPTRSSITPSDRANSERLSAYAKAEAERTRALEFSGLEGRVKSVVRGSKVLLLSAIMFFGSRYLQDYVGKEEVYISQEERDHLVQVSDSLVKQISMIEEVIQYQEQQEQATSSALEAR
ncbi:MAG: hypothetical protein AB7F43_02230 [Bacteriovoracia bacterium]